MLLARRLVTLISELGISSLMVCLLGQGDNPVSSQKGAPIAHLYPLDGSNVPPRREAVRVLRCSL